MNNIEKNLSKIGPGQMEELLAHIAGITVEENKENIRVNEKAREIEGLPIERWPAFDIRWDLSLAGQRFSFDGESESSFVEDYPNGLLLGWVCLNELDDKLIPYCKRAAGEIWSIGNSLKVARIIVHWTEGRSISPIIIGHNKHGQLTILGGNHRLAICRTKGERIVPVLANPTDQNMINDILGVIQWEKAT